jgi:hypothetical protein
MLIRLVLICSLSAFGFSTCAGAATDPTAVTGATPADWAVISDVNQIAAMRQELNKPNFSFNTVTIVRLTDQQGQRVDATTVGPTVVGFERGGPPAARSLITFIRKPDRLVLFTQDVKNWKAFRMEIPVAELTPGRSIRFPVVQNSGEVLEHEFTVQEVIMR